MHTVLITGGAGGLGKEISQLFKQLGYKIIVIDRLQSNMISHDLFQQIDEYLEIDLSDPLKTQQMLEHLITHKNLNISVVILAAAPRFFQDFHQIELTKLHEITNSSITSSMVILRLVLESMYERNFGRIISINSKSSVQGYASGSLYCAFKSAWLTFHESLSREFKKGNRNITITTLCPDSFSDIDGNKFHHSDKIISGIRNEIIKSIESKKSRIVFIVQLQTRILLTIQYLKKIQNLFK